MMKKDKGYIEYSLSLMLLLVVSILVLYGYRMSIVRYTKNMVEDGLVASNLAAGVIDLEIFGEMNQLIIQDCDIAYTVFRDALKDNLRLKEDFTPIESTLFNSKIKIHEFIIYNVFENDITRLRFTEDGHYYDDIFPNRKGSMTTPDGKRITNTTIYSKIGFEIKGIKDDVYYVYKDNSVNVLINQ